MSWGKCGIMECWYIYIGERLTFYCTIYIITHQAIHGIRQRPDIGRVFGVPPTLRVGERMYQLADKIYALC